MKELSKEMAFVWDWSGDTMGGAGWVVMVMGMIIFWALVVLAIAAMFRRSRDDAGTTAAQFRDPMSILDGRFARGEIDAEEYEARRDALRRIR